VLKYAAGLLAAGLALAPVNAGAAGASWEQWHTIKGVVDIGGPRTDGTMVVAGLGALYLLDAAGDETTFARGPGGYHDDTSGEAYLATAPAGPLTAAECSWTPDETFVERLRVPVGITRVSASGDDSGPFVQLPLASSLSGLAFDTTGSFDHRLLVAGTSGSKTVIFALDCNGVGSIVTRSAPALEGGLAVAPSTFGQFAGDLIAPDENSGNIYAIAPNGKVSTVIKPKLATGGDIGVESVGFVPAGFVSRGGEAYYADRATAGSPHPGSDSVLRLGSADIAAAGVQEGDMLVATEGGAALIAVHCEATCKLIPVVATPGKAHGEGHIVFTVNAPLAAPSARPVAHAGAAVVDFVGAWGVPIGVAAVVLLFVAGVAVQALRRRAR
jgi:hypothetical protein